MFHILRKGTAGVNSERIPGGFDAFRIRIFGRSTAILQVSDEFRSITYCFFPKNRLSFINSTFDFHDGDRKEVPGGYGPSPLSGEF
ncbi:uncharacterized protein Dmul_26860 [Desulfococcus multivorans]|nr:uncharacterized protein Dmul_26860 [Desulfococcus multivorans]